MSKEGLVFVKYYPFGTKHYMTILVPLDDAEVISRLNNFNKRQANRDAYIWRNTTIAKDISYIDRQAISNDDPEHLYIKNDIRKKLIVFIRRLTKTQQQVIANLLDSDFDFIKVASKMRRTERAIRYVYATALNKIRYMFECEYGYNFDFAKYINN